MFDRVYKELAEGGLSLSPCGRLTSCTNAARAALLSAIAAVIDPQTLAAPTRQGAVIPSQSRPEFFRLPKAGGDPYFGLGRSFYYQAEKLGYWRLIRLRQRGKLRGVTLIPYDAVAAFIRRQEGGNGGKEQVPGGILQ
jgi:hypothetical protein